MQPAGLIYGCPRLCKRYFELGWHTPRLRSSIRPVVTTRPVSSALMVNIRKVGPNHVARAQGSMRPTGSPISGPPGYAISFILSLATASSPNSLAGLKTSYSARSLGWPAVCPAMRKQGPDNSGSLVGNCHRSNISRAPVTQLCQPRPGLRAPPHNRSAAVNQ